MGKLGYISVIDREKGALKNDNHIQNRANETKEYITLLQDLSL
jgi:hypothetical protein